MNELYRGSFVTKSYALSHRRLVCFRLRPREGKPLPLTSRYNFMLRAFQLIEALAFVFESTPLNIPVVRAHIFRSWVVVLAHRTGRGTSNVSHDVLRQPRSRTGGSSLDLCLSRHLKATNLCARFLTLNKISALGTLNNLSGRLFRLGMRSCSRLLLIVESF